MATPVFESADSGAMVAITSDTSPLDVPYPSNIDEDDILLIGYCVSNGVEFPTTPSGWTLEVIKESTGGIGCITAVFSKVATGSESGTQAVANTSLAVKIARMHRISGGDSTEGANEIDDNGKIVLHPNLVTTKINCLGLTFTGIDDNETASSYANETGGDLTLLFDDTTALGNDVALSVQVANMPSPATISGGDWVFSGASENWTSVCLAIFNSADVAPAAGNKMSGLILPGHF